ncbi:MAG: oligosaccharide flippase family protein [Nitrospirota bacterium]
MAKFSLSDRITIVMLGNFIGTIAGLFLSIIMVRIMPVSDYGTYKQVMLISGIITTIFTLAIPRSIYYFIPILKTQRAGFILQTIGILFLLGLISSFSLWCFSKNIGEYFHNPLLVKLLKIFSISLIFNFPGLYLNPLLLSLDRQKLSAIISMLSSVISLLITIIPLLLGYGLNMIFFWMVLSSIIYFFLIFWYTLYLMKNWEFSWTPQLLHSQLSYSLPRGFSDIVGGLGMMIDKLVISIFFSAQKYAIYAVGTSKIALLELLFLPIGNVLFPKFSELYHQSRGDELIQLWHKYITKITLIVLPIFVFLFVMAEDVITVLFTKNYLESTGPFRVYLCALPLRMTLFGEVLEAMGQTKAILIGAIIFFISNLALNLLLVKTIGFIGPAIAILISAYISIFFYFFIIKSALKVNFVSIFPWKKFFRIFTVAGICGLLIYPVCLLNLSGIINLLITAIIFISIYILLIVKTRILTQQDIEFIKRWLNLKALSKEKIL